MDRRLALVFVVCRKEGLSEKCEKWAKWDLSVGAFRSTVRREGSVVCPCLDLEL